MEDIAALEKLKALLGIQGEEKNILVNFALESAEEIIKNYCHIEEIPEGLSATLYRIAVDIFKNEHFGEESAAQAIRSITIGDTSTSFGTAESSGYAESVIKDYKSQLNRFRKVVFS